MADLFDVIKAFNDEGFFPDTVVPDGKIHRFKRDSDDKGRSAWYVAHQNHSVKGGELFHVAVWADWHDPDNIRKYCSLTTQTKHDRKVIDDQIRAAEKRREEEQQKVWEETAVEAAKVWATLQDSGESEYMVRKKIGKLYGARTALGPDGRTLCVPVRDTAGRLWGLQRINPDGTKRFMAGTKKSGHFHIIPSEGALGVEPDQLYLCEGFATGASIHAATGKPVIVAFDAGNLVPVAAAVRQKFPSVPMVICADNDAFTKENPGKAKAEIAAARCGGTLVLPAFRSADGNPTDFNDLHTREGLSAVAEQVLGVKAERTYVLCLGHRVSTYYYSSSCNKQILAFNSHASEQLLTLQPLEYWEQIYPGKNGVDWTRAQSELKTACRARGIFNPSNIRGLGVWTDDSRTVVHLGNRLWVDGKEMGLHDLKTRHIYALDETQRPLTGAPLSNEDSKKFVDAIGSMAWARDQDHVFFTGWTIASMICGVLPWRPHLWLVGGSGAGKSTIYKVLSDLSHYQMNRFGGGTTEAGLRRAVRGSAVPVVFDEFELNNAQTMSTNQSILAFMRQASSDSDAQVVKADGATGTVSYAPRFCAFVTGIRPSFDNEADRNRFTLVELDRAKQTPEQWVRAKQLLDEVRAPGYASGLFSRSLALIGTFRQNQDLFENEISRRYYSRFGQQYAPILAGYVSLITDKVISAEEVKGFVDAMGLEHEVEGIREHNDDQDALHHLLSAKLRADGGDKSVMELINLVGDTVAAYTSPDAPLLANATLMRHGLKYDSAEKKLFIASKHPELSKLFDKTRFTINWNHSLGRLPHAEKSAVIRLFNKNCKGIRLPVETQS